MNLSFKEKSLWLSLLSTVVIFTYYFIQVFPNLQNAAGMDTELLQSFIVTFAVLVIVQIILQSTLAAVFHSEAKLKDERDDSINLRATRISHTILVLGIWLSALSLFILSSAVIMLNVLMFFFVLSEVVGYIMQLILYRRGV